MSSEGAKAFKVAQRKLADRWNCKPNQAVLKAILLCSSIDDDSLKEAKTLIEDIRVIRENTEELINRI